MAKYKILAFASSLSISAFASESAFAECVVPNVIANGQVADASKTNRIAPKRFNCRV